MKGEEHGVCVSSEVLLRMIPTPAIVHDWAGRVLQLNSAAERLFRQMGLDGREVTIPEAFGGRFKDWDRYLKSLEQGSVEGEHRWPLGDAELHAELRSQRIELEGQAVGLLVFNRIQRTADNRGLLEDDVSRLMARGSIDASGVSYYQLRAVLDADGDVTDFTFLDFNPAALLELRMTREQLLGGSIRRLFPINEDGGFFSQYRAVFLDKKSLQQEYHIPEGEPASGWYVQEVVPLEDGVGIFNREISEQKRAEEWLRQALEALPEPVFIADPRGTIRQVNAAAARVFRYAPEELVGKPVKCLMPTGHAARHDRYMADYLRTGFAKIIGNPRELTAVNKDGQEFPIRLAIGEMNVGEQKAFVGSVYDLRDFRALQEELRQTQKMEALGRLAGGVAHDFNNLLVVITQNALLLEQRAEDTDDAECQELAGEIHQAGKRAAELSRQLLQFSRRDVGQPQGVEACAAASRVAKLARRLLPETHSLSLTVPGTPIHVRIDPGELEQVLLNLIINARDAMPRGGELRLEVKKERFGVTGKGVTFSLQDEGEGMAPELRSRIFEPFFTTKPRGRGTGLGLSTVFGIVERAGGRVDVESAPGAGATFSVRLPESASAPAVAAVRAGPRARAKQRLRVLLVEDDGLVRSSIVRWLRAAGHDVAPFAGGQAALDATRGQSFDVMLTDVVMPGLAGPELAKRLAVTHPNLPVVFISGHPADLLSETELPDNAHFVPKPFEPDKLVETLEALAANGSCGRNPIDVPA